MVDRDELLDVEPGLLEEARRLMGRLPFDQLDLLVIGEIGKNYSGAGIDPERGRPAADRGRSRTSRRRRSRASAAWTCRRRATATAPASASPT